MEANNEIEERIIEFQTDLKEHSVKRIVRKRITFGPSFILDLDKYFDLKLCIADHFQINPNEVLLVGSGKLGFSIAPKKRYRYFGDKSDVDIAIISSSLFDDIWKQVYEYRNAVGYWNEEREFKSYMFRGWIRPDKLPPAYSFNIRGDWWEFFRSITNCGLYGPFQIRGALYKSWDFLEGYQSICVKSCQEDLLLKDK